MKTTIESGVCALPTPEPMVKRQRTETVTCVKDNHQEIKELMAGLERKVDLQFSKINKELADLQSSLEDHINTVSAQAQTFNGSLAQVLQKVLSSIKEMLINPNSGSASGQFLQSVVEFNKAVSDTLNNKDGKK